MHELPTSYLIIALVAFAASGLTFFSGFGLGTLLLPAFALFVPVEQAVVLTAIVHFLNGLFKLLLVGRHADWRIVLKFGVPAIVAAFAGAWALLWLSDLEPVFSYSWQGQTREVLPVKLVIGVLLLFFAMLEVLPWGRNLAFGPRYLTLGGLLSGFFGGLSGMQGALRSAFLVRAGLTKETFVATGAVIGTLIDTTRLAVYASGFLELYRDPATPFDARLLAIAIIAAFSGAMLGNYYLKKLTMRSIQRLVAVLLFLVALGMISGLL